MFDSVCHPSNCDAWALLFFQLMLYGVVSRERDRYMLLYFFSMLLSFVLHPHVKARSYVVRLFTMYISLSMHSVVDVLDVYISPIFRGNIRSQLHA